MYNEDMLTILLSFAIGFVVAVLLIGFRPVRHMVRRIFVSDGQQTHHFFDSLGRTLTTVTDLRSLLEKVAQEIQQTFGAKQVFFVVFYGDHHVSAGTKRHAVLPMADVRTLNEYLRQSGGEAIAADQISSHNPLWRLMTSHRIAVLLPLVHQNVVTGFLAVGERTGAHYTREEMRMLTSASKELVVAIQNALSLHEVKELNATLQQRIDVATKELRSSNAQLKHLDEVKDEFMSMASHQLRTPLTSVKGYLSMVLEGDAGEVSPQQRTLLTEAFNSSERMVRLIADFLNVSRLQTGKFTIEKSSFDIKELVRQVASDLDLIASTHDMKLRVTITDQELPVIADAAKIREIIMNFIDNAIYYSHAKSTIVVKLERVGDALAFSVVDTGIGVPEEDQTKLFTRFFRARNARKQRPDGTGVGLYLARRVVHGHGGSMIFSSVEGKGSTFGFRLPLDRLSKK